MTKITATMPLYDDKGNRTGEGPVEGWYCEIEGKPYLVKDDATIQTFSCTAEECSGIEPIADPTSIREAGG